MNRNPNNLVRKLESLSPEQVAVVEEFIDSLRVRSQDNALTRAASKASEVSFQEIWSNPEDDVYDAL